jgi:hypothetical protein
VTIEMWNPVKIHRGVPLRLFGTGILEVAGERAAILVCYELLLSLPIFQSAVERPTLVVGLANDNWVYGTTIPATQQVAATVWARLFRFSKLLALNL